MNELNRIEKVDLNDELVRQHLPEDLKNIFSEKISRKNSIISRSNTITEEEKFILCNRSKFKIGL